MWRISSKGMVCPKFRKVFVDPNINLKHQTKPYCECEEYFLGSLLSHAISLNCRNIFQTPVLVEVTFQKY